MKTKTNFIMLLTITLLLASCTGFSQSVDLDGTAWVLVRYANQAALPGTAPTLSFENSQVGGKASCNSFGGEVQIKGDRIVIGNLFSTMMACMDPEGVMEQEQAYLALLGEADHFSVVEGQLVITTMGGETLIFDPAN